MFHCGEATSETGREGKNEGGPLLQVIRKFRKLWQSKWSLMNPKFNSECFEPNLARLAYLDLK